VKKSCATRDEVFGERASRENLSLLRPVCFYAGLTQRGVEGVDRSSALFRVR
jgi:hypothetical protein